MDKNKIHNNFITAFMHPDPPYYNRSCEMKSNIGIDICSLKMYKKDADKVPVKGIIFAFARKFIIHS